MDGRRVTIGRLHVQVIDDFDPGELPRPLTLYLVVWRLVFGALAGLSGPNPFLDVFLGRWLVELYYDRDGTWGVE